MKKVTLLVGLLLAVLTLTACGSTEEGWDSSSNITVYTRDTSSGTRAGFMDGIGFDEGAESDEVLADGFLIKDNTGIFTSMQTDEFGIGYISLATLDTSVVKGLKFNNVEPTIANVINNTYELKRPFNYVIRNLDDFENDTEKDIVLAFIAFLESTDGADIITNKGAIPLDSTDSWDDIKANYPVCDATNDHSAITIYFGGSDSIQKIAEALTASFAPKCGNFTPDHDHTGSSDGFKRTQGSEKDGVNYKHVGFASRPFKTNGDEDFTDANTHGQLAWDAIVAIVHLDNEVETVTADDLKKIFSGEWTTWDQVLGN